jgi:yeast amino acid transporter
LGLGSKAGTLNDTAAKVAGFWECCSVALFSYTKTELVAITAWETENPRYTLPRAVRRISYRIILYYVGAVFVLGLTVSINDPLLQLPPLPDPNGQYSNRIYPGGFIILAERTGVLGMAHFINAVQVIAAVSVATAHIYITVIPLDRRIKLT